MAPRILPRRLVRRGGASVVRRDAALNRTEDLHVKVKGPADGAPFKIRGCDKGNSPTESCRNRSCEKSCVRIQTGSYRFHAALADRRDDCHDDERHRVGNNIQSEASLLASSASASSSSWNPSRATAIASTGLVMQILIWPTPDGPNAARAERHAAHKDPVGIAGRQAD